MTLRRQLIILVMLLFLFMFAGTFAISMHNTYKFVTDQLATHAQDTASSLGLSLSKTLEAGDTVSAARMVDAIYDRGYYKYIIVERTKGAPLVVREREVKFHGVPDWFIQLIPMETPEETALVMIGWKRAGIVKVAANPGHAYKELWSSAVHTFWWFASSSLLALVLGLLILHYLLKPLVAIRHQASEICRRNFMLLDKVPFTKDLRDVTHAMNRMSMTMKRAFEESAALTEKLREDAYTDVVTGLGNRRYFDEQLHHLLRSTEDVHQSALVLLEINDFKAYNDSHGYEAGDTLLRHIAELLYGFMLDTKDLIIAKSQGGGFALLLPNVDDEKVKEIADKIKAGLFELKSKGVVTQDDIAHMGIVMFSPGEQSSELLAQADMCLQKAKALTVNAWHLEAQTVSEATKGALDWAQELKVALAENRAVMYYQSVVEADEKLDTLMHYESLLRLPGQDGAVIPAGAFLPMAQRLNMMPDLDRMAVSEVLKQVAQTPGTVPFAVNLAMNSIKDKYFVQWLFGALAKDKVTAKRIIFELSEYHVVNHIALVKDFAAQINKFGAHLAIDNFGKGFSSFAYLSSLHLAYVKIDGSFVRGIDHDKDKQFYVQSLSKVAHGLHYQVIAETVETEAEKETLFSLGVDGLQGYIIGKPKTL